MVLSDETAGQSVHPALSVFSVEGSDPVESPDAELLTWGDLGAINEYSDDELYEQLLSPENVGADNVETLRQLFPPAMLVGLLRSVASSPLRLDGVLGGLLDAIETETGGLLGVAAMPASPGSCSRSSSLRCAAANSETLSTMSTRRWPKCCPALASRSPGICRSGGG